MALLLICGGCSAEAKQSEDAAAPAVADATLITDPPPPGPAYSYAETVWESVLPAGGYGVKGAVVLSTGIVAAIPPDLFLLDPSDGHVLATSPLPVDEHQEAANVLVMVESGTGDLAVLAGLNGDQLVLLRYRKEDLAQIGDLIVLEQESVPFGAMVAVDDRLAVLGMDDAGQEREMELLMVDGAGSEPAIERHVLPLVAHGVGRRGVDLPGSEIGFWAMLEGRTRYDHYAAMLRMDTAAGSVEVRRLGGDTSQWGRLAQGDDRLISVWGQDTDWRATHWMTLSADGSEILSDRPMRERARAGFVYLDDHVVGMDYRSTIGFDELVIHVMDLDAKRPVAHYSIPSEGRAGGSGAMVSDGDSLYILLSVRDGARREYRLQKLAPLWE
ncbi:MAG TPA: hypothetical protein VFG83_14060 [Kofleriaceae bacterium]|nr:hypothetical protein [Kofleriaceae bacterium]